MAAPIRSMIASRLKYFTPQFEASLCRDKSLTWCHVQFLYHKRHLVTAESDTDGSASALNVKPPNVSPSVTSDQPRFAVERGLGRTGDEQHWRVLMKPDQPPDAKILRMAIIGTPNAGKSTLTNRLMGWRVSSVSKKVHTTRRNTLAVYTEGNAQIIFMDTPGMLHPSKRKRHNLDRSLVTDPVQSLESADIVGVIVDVSNTWTRNSLDPVLLETLHLHPDKTAVLILNKVDALNKKQMLLQITRGLTEGIVGGVKTSVSTKRQNRAKKADLEEFFLKMRHGNETDNSPSEHLDSGLKNTPDEKDSSSRYADSDSSSDAENKVFEDSEVSSEDRKYEDRHILPLGWRTEDNLSASVDTEDPTWLDYHEKIRDIRKKIEKQKGWPHFDQVFMVSALNGDGVEEIRDFLLSKTRPGDWEYHSSVVTDQNPIHVAAMCVWEKLLEYLPQEIPYRIYPEIVLWEVDEDGLLNIMMDIVTTKPRHVQMILGKGGQNIQRIAIEAKQEMMNAFRNEVRLGIQVKHRPSKH